MSLTQKTLFFGHVCQKFSLRVWPTFCLIFCQFQPGVTYKSVAYKKSVYLFMRYEHWFKVFITVENFYSSQAGASSSQSSIWCSLLFSSPLYVFVSFKHIAIYYVMQIFLNLSFKREKFYFFYRILLECMKSTFRSVRGNVCWNIADIIFTKDVQVQTSAWLRQSVQMWTHSWFIYRERSLWGLKSRKFWCKEN